MAEKTRMDNERSGTMDGKLGEWLKVIGVIAIVCILFKACSSDRGGGCIPDDGAYSF